MKCRFLLFLYLIAVGLPMLHTPSAHADLSNDIRHLQHRWAEVNYQTQGDEQIKAFAELVAEAQALTAAHPKDASTWIWSGIIKSTYAGAKGGLGALSLAKDSKKDLEQALALDPQALEGSAYTSLGTLYFNVPGWPIGFGDNKKAEELLQRALAINPNGIDSNYFYGDFLMQQKQYARAKDYLLKAQAAPARTDRPLADAGRQREIKALLTQVEKKLH